MKVDRGIPNRIDDVPEAAAGVERQGYDGCWTGEINHDPFLLRQRCHGTVDRAMASLPAGTPEPVVARILDELRGA